MTETSPPRSRSRADSRAGAAWVPRASAPRLPVPVPACVAAHVEVRPRAAHEIASAGRHIEDPAGDAATRLARSAVAAYLGADEIAAVDVTATSRVVATIVALGAATVRPDASGDAARPVDDGGEGADTPGATR